MTRDSLINDKCMVKPSGKPCKSYVTAYKLDNVFHSQIKVKYKKTPNNVCDAIFRKFFYDCYSQ